MELAITQLENNDSISTGLRVNKNMTIMGIRLRIYKHGSPDGALTLDLKDGSDTVNSTTLSLSELSSVGTYFHGYVLLEFDSKGGRVNLDPEQTYKQLSLEISLSAHTNSSSNYIGLIKNSSNDQFVTSYGVINSEDDMTESQLLHFQPYGIEIYSI